MRKFLLPLITIGIFIGVTFSLKDIFTNDVIKEVNNEIEHEVYIDELNLPIIEIDTMNPILTKNKQLSDVLKLIYEPLFDFDEKNKLVPKLATEWNEKDDKTWIIKLNKLASWHSGKEFSAEDIIFTYNEINKSEDSIYKENIKNISSIEKLDEHTIQVNLLEKDRFVLYKLIFPILPKGYFDNSPDSEVLNGTGPYKYDSKLENGVIKLTANLQWWNSETFKLKKIYLYEYSTYGEAIKAFKSTEIDIIPTTMSSWQKKFGAIGINSYMYESSEYETIIANTNDSVLSDSSVRRAILTVINSENIIESVYNGNGEVSNYPVQNNSYLNFNEENNNYDIEKAKKLLINAGWDNTYGIWKKEIENKACSLDLELLVNSDNEEKVQVAELIIENLKEIGINTKLVKVKSDEFTKRILNQKFELALVTLNLDMDIDILELLESSNEKNYAKYVNDEIDNIIFNIKLDNIENKYLEIYNIYKNESPYIGLYYKCNNLLTNKSVKGNINPTSWNVYHGITGWCK